MVWKYYGDDNLWESRRHRIVHDESVDGTVDRENIE